MFVKDLWGRYHDVILICLQGLCCYCLGYWNTRRCDGRITWLILEMGYSSFLRHEHFSSVESFGIHQFIIFHAWRTWLPIITVRSTIFYAIPYSKSKYSTSSWQNRQKTVWRSALLLIRHSKYSHIVKNTLLQADFSAILPTGLFTMFTSTLDMIWGFLQIGKLFLNSHLINELFDNGTTQVTFPTGCLS